MGKKSNHVLRELYQDSKKVNRRLEKAIDILECGKKMSHIEKEIGIGIDIGKVAREQEK